MVDLIGTASTAIDLVRRLSDINKKVANAEFAKALADLSMELSELKVRVAHLVDENDQLKREVSAKQSKVLQFRGYAYFDSDNGGPYCPGCYDDGGKVVRLAALPKGFTDLASHTCPVCDAAFSADARHV